MREGPLGGTREMVEREEVTDEEILQQYGLSSLLLARYLEAKAEMGLAEIGGDDDPEATKRLVGPFLNSFASGRGRREAGRGDWRQGVGDVQAGGRVAL